MRKILAILCLVFVAAVYPGGRTINRGAVIVVSADRETYVDLHLNYAEGDQTGFFSVLLYVNEFSTARIVNPFESAQLSVQASGPCTVIVYDSVDRPDPTRGDSRPVTR